MRIRKLALVVVLASASTGAFVVHAAADPQAASLTLYGGENYAGAPVTVTRNISNLQEVAASDGFDGTANDYAHSLRAIGRWEVCMDAGYRTDCMVVHGHIASLGERNGSISSVRLLAAPTAGATVAASRGKREKAAPRAAAAPAPTSTPAPASEWRPMYNTDLFGGDLRGIVYDRPGNDWRSCKAACDGDRQCRSWTYVVPGRTEHGECFLKDSIPERSESDCCISGIKGAPSANLAPQKSRRARQA